MSSVVRVELFVEDHAHEAFLVPMLRRIAHEEKIEISPHVRSARGGHGRAIDDFVSYQDLVEKGITGTTRPDLLLTAIDANCRTLVKRKQEIEDATRPPFSHQLVVACPDPHVERWYLADPESFQAVVGHRPKVGRKKCERDHYKRLLAEAVVQAGHPATLGGIEFAGELVDAMDLYRASRADRSLKSFVADLRAKFRLLRPLVSESRREGGEG